MLAIVAGGNDYVPALSPNLNTFLREYAALRKQPAWADRCCLFQCITGTVVCPCAAMHAASPAQPLTCSMVIDPLAGSSMPELYHGDPGWICRWSATPTGWVLQLLTSTHSACACQH